MNSHQRTYDFINGLSVDRPPFHPILMRFAAQYAGVKYRDFCLSPVHKCETNIKCSTDFSYDWVNVMSDAYAEAEAYGVKLIYPEDNLPQVENRLLKDISDTDKLSVLKINDHSRLKKRVEEIKEYKKRLGNAQFICGWVEGPFAEYCDIRDLSSACMDFYEYPEKLKLALNIITESAMRFITAQVNAGAHCIGIGDAVCSLISPELYREFVFPLEKTLIDHAHSLNSMVKLHICGNTTAILPDMIKTGADIVDIDHLVTSMGDFVPLFSQKQVPSGNSDPVSVIRNGNRKTIEDSVLKCFEVTNERGIVSAGCEIPPDTPLENFIAYRDAAHKLGKMM
ncbi:MAG TPA: uroporphyrinogen decarboxylase family protein [Bacteroidales bacterium]|nr:uroporphyrinogen decarboxylase family protein [Bacteroidales bacterium]HPT20800.1 uroporphyrinogen decarboxylase family protein [Bacteroidales bacterium]